MNLVWRNDAGTVLKNDAMDGSLVFAATFPGVTGKAQKLLLSTPAVSDGTYASLRNVQVFLSGDAGQIDTLLNVWPNYSLRSTPNRAELNGGIEVSFDRGYSFRRLGALPDGTRSGFPDDPSTWITLPRACILPGSSDGILGPFDLATLFVRYVVPPLADQFQIFDVRLEAAFDVV